MNTASTSGRPIERSSCCWVPSPQSNSSRSPPARSSSAGSPRRAVGTDPAVPAKNSDRSMRGPRLVRNGDALPGPRCSGAPSEALVQELEQVPGGYGRPGEVREDSVDPEPVELQVLLERVVVVV